MAEIPGRTSFNLENPVLADWLDEQSLELSGQVSQTTIDNLSDTLRDGIRAGEGMPDLTKRVRGTFTDASRSRANLIARTEANKAANGASWTQATRSGVVKTKTWIATGDARTRPEHRAMNGETVPLDKPFSNGLMFPSEPRCRCTLTYGIDEAKLAGERQPEVAELRPRRVPESELRADWDERNFGAWKKSLTAQERQDLYDYQNGPHGDLNRWLRTGEELPEELKAEYETWRENLDAAIGKGASPEDLTVFRGFENPDISRNFDRINGTIIGDEGYTSTSLSEPVAKRFTRGANDPILAEIRVPKGSKMGYVDSVNSVDEFEALLPRGTRFRVVSADYDERGRKHMVLEVVGG